MYTYGTDGLIVALIMLVMGFVLISLIRFIGNKLTFISNKYNNTKTNTGTIIFVVAVALVLLILFTYLFLIPV